MGLRCALPLSLYQLHFMPATDRSPKLMLLELESQRLEIILSGDWVAGMARPTVDVVEQKLRSPDAPRKLSFDTTELGQWDSLLLTFLARILELSTQQDVAVDRGGLPVGIRGMLGLADAVPERQDARRQTHNPGLLAQVGNASIAGWNDFVGLSAFIGEVAISLVNFLLGRARFRRVDFWLLIQECGVNALPIVSLISLLVGMILAFVGSTQLSNYGAQVYIADMVGLGMSREMGALMTAIIMAGRTGAAFAAQLGSMQVNDEIDALKTMGFSEMEFLVLPRLLALILMMPLLCLYADLMGMIGGGVVSVSLFDISILEYSQHILRRLGLHDFMVGVGKSAVFGVLVAIAGCMRGMQCGRSSQAVGLAATSAVVTCIVMIVSMDAVMTLVVIKMRW